MPTVTVQDLNNAKADVDHIADIANSSSPTAVSRLGTAHRTISGANAEMNALLAGMGYLPPVAYAAGVVLSNSRQTVEYNGSIYSPLIASIPFTASGTFETNKFRLVQGATMEDLAMFTTYRVSSYSDLRASTTSAVGIYVTGSLGNGQAGNFVLDAADTTSPDNGGTTLVRADGKRYKRPPTARQRPEWYGSLSAALANCPEYTSFDFANATYDFIGGHVFEAGQTFVANRKRGIKFYGSGMPSANSDFTALVGGTVIRGVFANLADDFEIHNMGVDCGPNVVAQAGKHLEGLILGTVLGTPNTIPLLKGVKCQNVTVLLGTPNSADDTTKKHAMLAENLSGPIIDNVKLYRGWHGWAYKSQGGKIGSIQVYGAMADSYIIKGDPTSTAANTTIQSIYMSSLDGTPNTPRGGPGVWESGAVAAGGNGGVKNITIGSITGNYAQAMIFAQGGNAKISGIQVGFVGGSNVDSLAVFGANVDGFVIDRWRGETVASNGMYMGVGSNNIKLGSGEINGSANNGYVLNGNVIYDLLQASDCAQWGVSNETGVIDPLKIGGGNNGSGLISKVSAVGLSVNWTGAAPSVLDFTNLFYGNKCVIRGSLRLLPGKTEVVLVVEAPWRPKSARSYPITGFVGTTFKSGVAVLNTDGRLVISNFTEFVNGEVCLGNIEWYLNEP